MFTFTRNILHFKVWLVENFFSFDICPFRSSHQYSYILKQQPFNYFTPHLKNLSRLVLYVNVTVYNTFLFEVCKFMQTYSELGYSFSCTNWI